MALWGTIAWPIATDGSVAVGEQTLFLRSCLLRQYYILGNVAPVMTNIIQADQEIEYDGTTRTLFLDAAAELSKLERKNHKQVTDKGVPLVYDMTVECWTPTFNNSNVPFITGNFYTAPDHWVTRNAVRMAHFEREKLRKEAGVAEGSIGRYARNMRFNLNGAMYGIAYDNTTAVAFNARLYAQNDGGNDISGGVWDYTQLSQVDPTDTNLGDGFYMVICGTHSAAAPGPYTYIGVNKAYIERRQTVLADATQTPGGSPDNVVTGSPFFRVPEQDESEDLYQTIIQDEQDNPPYDRTGSLGTTADSADVGEVWVDSFQLGQTGALAYHSVRVQAPLGLLKLKVSPVNDGEQTHARADMHWKITCHGTYEM